MKHFAGMDLGAENLRFFGADETGLIKHMAPFPSPFKKTGGKYAGSSPEVLLDTIRTGVPQNERVRRYLKLKYDEFLEQAAKQGMKDFEAVGAQMAGKVWQREGRWYLMGSNTPGRFAVKDPEGSLGILIDLEINKEFVGANDGNAAAKAQSIYYKAIEGLVPATTGYIILGGGFGLGVPDTETQTEGGHVPVGFIHPALYRKCGCSPKVEVACAENYASGPGIAATAKQVIGYSNAGPNGPIKSIAAYEKAAGRIDDLEGAIRNSSLYKKAGDFEPKDVMELAHNGDAFASWIVDLAAEAVKIVAIASAQLYGLQRIGIGESVAENNPWFVDKVAKMVSDYTNGNTLLPNGLKVELTPIKEAGKYGALSLVVPTELYQQWAQTMKR